MTQIDWSSHQGRRTRSNNDAAAVGRKGHYLLAMLVDAAEKGDGQALARHWAQIIVRNALAANEPPSTASLIDVMRVEQHKLRHQHLHAVASYCCALVDLRLEQLHLLHVGDCRAGIRQNSGHIDWLTRPHDLSQQPIWPASYAEASQYRHMLTRSLNAKRFYVPECQNIPFSTDTSLVLCSDGYWYEHQQLGVALQEVDDDTSILALQPNKPAPAPTISEGLFIISV